MVKVIAAAHERFNGIRQVAPVCTPPNTFLLGPTPVQMSNVTWIGSPSWALQKQLNRSRCRLGSGLGWARGTQT